MTRRTTSQSERVGTEHTDPRTEPGENLEKTPADKPYHVGVAADNYRPSNKKTDARRELQLEPRIQTIPVLGHVKYRRTPTRRPSNPDPNKSRSRRSLHRTRFSLPSAEQRISSSKRRRRTLHTSKTLGTESNRTTTGAKENRHQLHISIIRVGRRTRQHSRHKEPVHKHREHDTQQWKFSHRRSHRPTPTAEEKEKEEEARVAAAGRDLQADRNTEEPSLKQLLGVVQKLQGEIVAMKKRGGRRERNRGDNRPPTNQNGQTAPQGGQQTGARSVSTAKAKVTSRGTARKRGTTTKDKTHTQPSPRTDSRNDTPNGRSIKPRTCTSQPTRRTTPTTRGNG